MKTVIQSLILIAATLIVFFIENTALVDYMIYFLLFMMLIGILIMIFRKITKKSDLFMGSYFEMFIITILILFTILLTSGIASPIFFLLYFLLFGISFMFEPAVIFVMLACILLLFGQEAVTGDIYSNMLKMVSLILLSPLAYFFGNEYKRREKIEEQINAEAASIKQSAEELLAAKKLNKKERNKIETIQKKATDIEKEVHK